MGMYTGLRVKVYVKQEYRKMIEEINNGEDWSEFTEEFPFLTSYSEQSRAEFIPNGALCYMPSRWESGEFPNYIPTDGFDRNIDLDTGYWTFQCSLKNYNNEIGQFFEEVLSNIIGSAEHIEFRYEEMNNSIMYAFKDGKIKTT